LELADTHPKINKHPPTTPSPIWEKVGMRGAKRMSRLDGVTPDRRKKEVLAFPYKHVIIGFVKALWPSVL
jgi:hypothetical protein